MPDVCSYGEIAFLEVHQSTTSDALGVIQLQIFVSCRGLRTLVDMMDENCET